MNPQSCLTRVTKTPTLADSSGWLSTAYVIKIVVTIWFPAPAMAIPITGVIFQCNAGAFLVCRRKTTTPAIVSTKPG